MGCQIIDSKYEGVEVVVTSSLLGKEPVSTNEVRVLDGVAHFIGKDDMVYAVSAPFVVSQRKAKAAK